LRSGCRLTKLIAQRLPTSDASRSANSRFAISSTSRNRGGSPCETVLRIYWTMIYSSRTDSLRELGMVLRRDWIPFCRRCSLGRGTWSMLAMRRRFSFELFWRAWRVRSIRTLY
jgi:hypothetical protein